MAFWWSISDQKRFGLDGFFKLSLESIRKSGHSWNGPTKDFPSVSSSNSLYSSIHGWGGKHFRRVQDLRVQASRGSTKKKICLRHATVVVVAKRNMSCIILRWMQCNLDIVTPDRPRLKGITCSFTRLDPICSTGGALIFLRLENLIY